MPDTDKNEFWQFSLQLYAESGVAETCLKLQNQHGGQVNVILWCLWLGGRGITLTSELLLLAARQLQPWQQQATVPMRDIRQNIKACAGADSLLYQQAKAFELELERYEQDLLWRLSPAAKGNGAGRGGVVAAHNLQIYTADWPNTGSVTRQPSHEERKLYDVLLQFLG
jgi:uncharacterized protein (TIGR02444 family)